VSEHFFKKLEDVPVSNDELRELAHVAMRDYPVTETLGIPSWIGDLASLPPPSFHALDRLMHDGLIRWSDGWRLTEVGWKALHAAAPRVAK
jgi:hypothetical protein